MKRWVVNAQIVTALAGVAAAGATILAWPYLWLRQPQVVVTVNGHPTFHAVVYRAHNQQLLVWGDGPLSLYLIDPVSGLVGSPDVDWFSAATRRFAVSNARPEEIAAAASTNDDEFASQARVVFRRGKYVEFTDTCLTPVSHKPYRRDAYRVRVSLR